MTVNITQAFSDFWSIVATIFDWLRSFEIVLGSFSFSLLELFISLIAISIIWAGVVKIFYGD